MPPEKPAIQFEEERFAPTVAAQPEQASAFYRIAYKLGATDEKQATTFLLAGAVLIALLALGAYLLFAPATGPVRTPASPDWPQPIQ